MHWQNKIEGMLHRIADEHKRLKADHIFRSQSAKHSKQCADVRLGQSDAEVIQDTYTSDTEL